MFRLALLALLTTPAAAHAFECKVSESYRFVPLHWTSRGLAYGIQSGAVVDPTLVARAFSAWSDVGCTDLSFFDLGVLRPEDETLSQVVFIDDDWLALGTVGRPVDAVAVTQTTYLRASGEIQRALIEVNQERFRFGDVSLPGCTTDYDLEAVLTHEVGHFLGLDHTLAYDGLPTDPTMAPVVDACDAEKRSLGEDDILGVCTLYPPDGPAGRCHGLPSQVRYVRSAPFGCRAAGSAPASPVLGLLWVLAGLAVRRRVARGRPCTCPPGRSGG